MPISRRDSSDTTYISIRNSVRVPNIRPFGLNIGFHNRFGASQILKNLIVNPGFEAGEYATIIIVDAGGSAQRFVADNWQTRWNDDALKIGQPNGYWEGAEYEVVFGKSMGRRGHIIRFRHENDRYAFYTSERGEPFAQGDVVYVRQQVQASTVGMTFAAYDWNRFRPNSYGKQSLRLEQPERAWQWSYSYTMDSLWRDQSPQAGKLLIADGDWELSFWVRGSSRQSKLKVQFGRDGEPAFFKEEVPVDAAWRRITRSIHVPPGADPYFSPDNIDNARVLSLKFCVTSSGPIWIDDMSLQRKGQTNPTVFSDRFVEKLKEYRPGTLRNWGHQLGSTLENQLAVPTARRMTGYSPKQREATLFHYSLHEFLELAQEVGANPWYVIPPTFTQAEIQSLVAYLAAPHHVNRFSAMRASLGQREPWTDVFNTIHLEYGNEMWGANQGTDPFLGATVRGGERLGTIAGQRFFALRRSRYFKRNLNLIIGGQTNVAERQAEITQHSQQHDTVALSPYFGHLDDQTPSRMFLSLYARAFQDVQSDSYGLLRSNVNAMRRVAGSAEIGDQAVYEINFHTTTGANIPLATRNRFVSSIAGGIALPLYMLMYLQEGGVRTQCAFTMLQFSFQMSGQGINGEDVRLWGLLRDLEATGRARPTWLAMQLVNQAMRGHMVHVEERGKRPVWQQLAVNHIGTTFAARYVHPFVFTQRGDFSVLLFNLHQSEAQPVELEFPELPLSQGWMHQLSAESPFANNEEREDVRIRTTRLQNIEPQYAVTLPPHSITLIETKGVGAKLPFSLRSITNSRSQK